jgi:16S rRNA G1207 methylase RsmC
MTNPMPAGSTNRKIDSIIELGRCSDRHRILLAGASDPDPVSEWRSRGYHRVATMAASRLPRGQYDVAVVEWRQHSIRALETMLDWLVHFLSPRGVLVICIDGASGTASARRDLRSLIERLGFRVETAKRCQNGFAVSASRLTAGQQAMAA